MIFWLLFDSIIENCVNSGASQARCLRFEFSSSASFYFVTTAAGLVARQGISFLSFGNYLAALTAIPPLTKATFNPTIQRNLGLPSTLASLIHPSSLSVHIHSLHVSNSPKHSDQFYWPTCTIPALLWTISFLTPANLLKHFMSRKFSFVL